ncbi:hypothetical protein BDZ91DRAFT_722454, partial [Kalaharituber pfeilii]
FPDSQIPRFPDSDFRHICTSRIILGKTPFSLGTPQIPKFPDFLKLTSAAEHPLLSQHLRSLSTPLNTVHPLNTIHLLIQLIKFYQM